MKSVIDCYAIWCLAADRKQDHALRSSNLFDTVAVHMAMSDRYLQMQELPLVFDDTGLMRIDAAGNRARCAVEWLDLPAFKRELVDRLTGAFQDAG